MKPFSIRVILFLVGSLCTTLAHAEDRAECLPPESSVLLPFKDVLQTPYLDKLAEAKGSSLLTGVSLTAVDNGAGAVAENVVCVRRTLGEYNPAILQTFKSLEKDFPKAVYSDEGNLCVFPDQVGKQRREEFTKAIQSVPVGPVMPESRFKLSSQPLELPDFTGKALAQADPKLQHHTLRHAATMGGIALAGFGVLLVVPESISKWDKSQKAMKNSFKHIKRAWTTAPVWDHDDWAINYIGHPMAGAMYYLTERNNGESWKRSLAFSVASSTTWEYVIESFAEQPSIQDLIVTPLVGSAMGELSHRLTEHMKKNGLNTFEKIALTVVNPVFAINRYR